MRRWPLALLLGPALTGCAGGHAVAPPAATQASLPTRGTVARCLADWNGPGNASARAIAAPPLGPYPTDGGQEVSLRGTFEVHVGLSLVIGAPGTDPPPRCYVFFRFPRGHRGGPAKVSFGETDLRRGVYGDPIVNFGKDADAGGRVYLEGRDGKLRPAPVARTGAAKCPADWNGPANASVRAGAAPPLGPFLMDGRRPLRPHGHFQAFVGLSTVIGAVGTNPPPVCYVYFRFPRGYRGGPALVSFPEIDRRHGVYGDPSITVGNDTDVGGRIYAERADGRLHPTGRRRRA
jgi:hypothetical protein